MPTRRLALAAVLACATALAATDPPDSVPVPPSAVPAAPATPAPAATPSPPAAKAPRAEKADKPAAKAMTMREVLAASKPVDWHPIDPAHTLYLETSSGRVVIELAPFWAPKHVANIEKLAKAHWYDGLAIVRVQDNFVVQWGDPLQGKPEVGEKRLPPEFTHAGAVPGFVRLKEPDTYAPEVGFVGDFPAARTAPDGDSWLAHCYGMVGVGRDNDPSTAIGTELYAVIGHAPRQLDRNVAVVGRVVWGMELLSALPRGTGDLGMYEQPEQRVPIERVRLASEVPVTERIALEALRTDSAAFQKLIEARRNRRDAWYKVPAGHIDLCNVPLPVREHGEPKRRG